MRQRCGWSAAGSLLCLLAWASAASAQSVGYQLNRYEPAPAGDPFAVVEYPWYSAIRWFAARLSLDYAHDIVAAQHQEASGEIVTDPSPIAHQNYARLDLAAAAFDRVALTLSIPVLLHEQGTAFNGVGPTGTVFGDPRVGIRARLWGQPDAALSVSASAYLWIPVGAAADHAGDDGVRLMPRLSLGGIALDRLRWAVNASFLHRQTSRLSAAVSPIGNTVGSEAQLSTGLAYVTRDRRISVGPEAILLLSVAGDMPEGQNAGTLELFGTGRYQVTDKVDIGLGVGTAVAGTPGPPDFRVLLSFGYTPRAPAPQTLPRVRIAARPVAPPDRDRDAIADAKDACPDRAGLASSDPIRHGCPKATEKIVVMPDEDGHVGGVEVDDGKTLTVLDQPYASAEVGQDGGARAVEPAQPAAVKRSVAAIARALPPSDYDSDGIIDAKDACPERAGNPSKDPVRNGCPVALEKVVVLPDADGHIGGIEVNDGKTTTVVDKPYASAEVGAAGGVQAVPPAKAKSIEQSIAKVANALPIADDDGDLVRDEDDACPGRPGVASRDPIRNGCPNASERVVVLPDADGHVGGVEVNDGKTVTMLDRAFATSEVGRDGKAKAVPSSPAYAIERSVGNLAKTLPRADRDNDRIEDAGDACPDRAGGVDPDPARNGCPRAVETVVVLPDDDGHVGALEVDDGVTVTVIDQAYATVEVARDGRSHKVATEPAAVTAKFARAIAARPAGARVVLYFNRRAEPVRDISADIDAVAAEVRSQTAYTIDVVGHTDHVGSPSANRRIGRARAQLIAERLIAAGIPRARVHVISKGSSEPEVQATGGKTVELRNRRVEIIVRKGSR